MALANKKADQSDTKKGTWIRDEHYKLDMIHYSIIFTLFGGSIFLGCLLLMSYIDTTKPFVKSVIDFFL